MELGAKIKRLRLQCGLTQEELADRCELTKGYISQLENELTSPSIQTLLDVLSALGTTAAEFFAARTKRNRWCSPRTISLKRTRRDTSSNGLCPTVSATKWNRSSSPYARAAASVKDMPHEGEEFGFVKKGSCRASPRQEARSLRKRGRRLLLRVRQSALSRKPFGGGRRGDMGGIAPDFLRRGYVRQHHRNQKRDQDLRRERRREERQPQHQTRGIRHSARARPAAARRPLSE